MKEYAMNISHTRHNFKTTASDQGFTLVEVMIAMFVSILVMASLATVYIAQTQSYSQQDDLAAIQQDLRGALVLLPMEMRLAGCDPTESNAAGVINATRTNFHFTLDIAGNPVTPQSGDGDVNDADEDITFSLFNPDPLIANADANNNGIVDNGGADWSGTGSLGRNNGPGPQPLADNIEALEFNYILNNGTSTLTPGNLNRIRSVQVSILARATVPATGFVNTATYTTASGVVWNPPDDNFRRRLVVTNIQLRNLGY